MEWKLLSDETEEEYIYRICSHKDEIGTWSDVADIINCTLGYKKSSSAYRKVWESFNKMLDIYIKHNASDEEAIENFDIARRALEKERKKLQTEKIEYNRWLREEARDELFLEKITESIKEYCTPYAPVKKIKAPASQKRFGLLCFGDCHFGKAFEIKGLFNETINEYSEEIFYERMEKLLSETFKIIQTEGFTDIHVFNLGDSLDGFLRHSQLASLEHGVIDSAILFGNYMAEWLQRLSSVVNVKYFSVDGNHSEIRILDGKKGQHLNESTDKIINNIIDIKLSNNDNFQLITNEANIIIDSICGYNILGIHGEVKSLEQAAEQYQRVYDVKCDYIFGGHLHHFASSESGTRSMAIGIGSIVGSDDYSIKLRRSADASANFFIFEPEKGLVQTNRIVLN